MKKISIYAVGAVLLSTAQFNTAIAQSNSAVVASSDSFASIQAQLETRFTPAKATSDDKDIEAAGTVLVLQKDNLIMNRVDKYPTPTANVYKNGQISQTGVFGTLDKLFSLGGAAISNGPHTFVRGDKFWATKILVNNDGITLQLMSDPINGARYHATLNFPYSNGSAPTADQATQWLADVFATEVFGNAAASAPAQAQDPIMGQAPTGNEPPIQVELGQSKDDVVAQMGPPTKIVKLGAKEMYYYPDMKVIFVKNKVTDVQ